MLKGLSYVTFVTIIWVINCYIYIPLGSVCYNSVEDKGIYTIGNKATCSKTKWGKCHDVAK